MIKGWAVGTADVGFIWCLAETRGRARRFFDDGYRENFTGLRVRRARWLDGEGPEREVMPVFRHCDGEHDEYGGCLAGRYWCYEGEWIDREATVMDIRERSRDEATMAETIPASPTVEIDRKLLEDAVDCVYDCIALNEQYPLKADEMAVNQAIAARIEAILQRDEPTPW